MKLFDEIAEAIELHSVEGIRACFEQGLDPNSPYQGKRLFDFLTSMYTRSPKFGACVQVFIEAGVTYDNKALLSVLVDDPAALSREIELDPQAVNRPVTLECAYTPLFKASLLHVCAEFNRVACARLLLDMGLDADVMAGVDETGFGGQTPIFHTVNQNSNQSAEMMDMLLDNGADLSHTVKGLVWGKNMPWETFIPAVNPVSYAMFGRLPQMHRNEKTTAEVVQKLVKYAYGIDYAVPNVPNRYLAQP